MNNCIRSYAKRILISINPMINVGPSFYIEKNARIVTVSHWGCGHVTVGRNFFLGEGALMIAQGGDIVIGNNTTVNPYTVMYGMGGLVIGNNVRIGPRCTIIPQNHMYKSKDKLIIDQRMCSLGVVIDDDVWLGAGVIILDGVHISIGCVIGAGSIVTKSTEPYNVYVGVPAKSISRRC